MDVLISTAAGAIAGFLAALVKGYFDSRAKVDDQLHAARTALYRELWRQSAVLPKWPRAQGVTCERLALLSEWLRDWYFGVGTDAADRVPGGLYLSRAARRRYGKVQATLKAVSGHAADEVLSDTDYLTVQRVLSRLRNQMTGDLLSRRGAPFRIAWCPANGETITAAAPSDQLAPNVFWAKAA